MASFRRRSWRALGPWVQLATSLLPLRLNAGVDALVESVPKVPSASVWDPRCRPSGRYPMRVHSRLVGRRRCEREDDHQPRPGLVRLFKSPVPASMSSGDDRNAEAPLGCVKPRATSSLLCAERHRGRGDVGRRAE